MTCVLGIDIGTTSTIGILISLPDRVKAMATRPVTFSSPQQGWAEEDPAEWWHNICEIVPELLTTAGIDKTDICGVGVTGMLPAVVLLDKKKSAPPTLNPAKRWTVWEGSRPAIQRTLRR